MTNSHNRHSTKQPEASPPSTAITEEEARFRALTQRIYEALLLVLRENLNTHPTENRLCSARIMEQAYEETLRHSHNDVPNRNEFFWLGGLLFRYLLVQQRSAFDSILPDRFDEFSAIGVAWGIASHGEELVLSQLPAFHRILSRLELVQPRQGQIVIMRIFAGMDFSEIGDVLALPEHHVGKLWIEARARFADALSPTSGFR